MKRHGSVIAVVIALASSSASAQPLTGPAWEDDAEQGRHSVAIEIGFAHRGRTTFPVAPTVTLVTSDRFAGLLGVYASARTLTRTMDVGALALDVDLAWRFGYHATDEEPEGLTSYRDEAIAGNPVVSARLAWSHELVRVSAALGLGAPVQDVSGGAADVLRAAYGHGDAWLLTAGAIPIIARVAGELSHEVVVVALEIAGAVAPELEPITSVTRSFGQVSATVALRPVPALALGMRPMVAVQAPVHVTPPNLADDEAYYRDEEAFVSLVSFVRIEDAAWMLEGRFLVNLDDPYNRPDEPAGTWSVSLLGGWRPAVE